jgi:hypothetical protein|uniref:Uncharacterized protein n=1 Tax=Bacteriophage sp. TaxID=38018 RepID=A0A8D9UHS8_9VIRU|nr:MAG TPA: hypothetical protein [Bacteriophage sp.]
MNWKNFFEHRPKNGERILIIYEWCTNDIIGRIPTKHYTIYECNYKNIEKSVYAGIDMSMVYVVNLKIIDGEKLHDHLEKRQFYSKFVHWTRLD